MKHTFYPDIRGPLVPRTGLVLGAAGRRGRSAFCPDLCQMPSALPFSGNCPCGAPPRPL